MRNMIYVQQQKEKNERLNLRQTQKIASNVMVIYMEKAEIYCDESDLKTYEQEEHFHNKSKERKKRNR